VLQRGASTAREKAWRAGEGRSGTTTQGPAGKRQWKRICNSSSCTYAQKAFSSSKHPTEHPALLAPALREARAGWCFRCTVSPSPPARNTFCHLQKALWRLRYSYSPNKQQQRTIIFSEYCDSHSTRACRFPQRSPRILPLTVNHSDDSFLSHIFFSFFDSALSNCRLLRSVLPPETAEARI